VTAITRVKVSAITKAARWARRLWRHHPANAGAWWQWLAVVGSDISVAPSAGGATAATLYFSDRLGGVEAFYRQCRFMVTGPIAIALAATTAGSFAASSSLCGK
jgi:hypothetical protein